MAAALIASAALALTAPAGAQTPEVTLRLQHALPADSTAHTEFLKPWADRVMRHSAGRIAIEIYPAMQLGGTPASLFDQVRHGAIDLAWTQPDYTPTRFPLTAIFELPFMAAGAEATSRALQEFYGRRLTDEFAAVHVLALHADAPGLLHVRQKRVKRLEDLVGLRVRAPDPLVAAALATLGAVPVELPAASLPQAFAGRALDAVVLSCATASALGVPAQITSRTEGARGLTTTVFLFAMNRDSYDGLPDDLRRIIDANSGPALAAQAGAVWDRAEERCRATARAERLKVRTLDPVELARWEEATAPAIQAWRDQIDALGLDGAALLEEARALVAKHAGGG